MKIKALSLFLLLSIVSILFAEENVVPVYSGPRGQDLKGENVYTVVKGDTLWDICKTKFNNPWLWVKVWERNPHITDPNWIYPGDKILLDLKAPVKDTFVKKENKKKYASKKVETTKYSGDVKTFKFVDNKLPFRKKTIMTQTETPVKYVEPNDSNKKNQVIKRTTQFAGFILEENKKPFAKIIDIADNKLLASYNDIVFINRGTKNQVREGDEFLVYEIGKKIENPKNYSNVGSLVTVAAKIKVLVAYKKISKCRVIDSVTPFQKGYYADYEYPKIVLSKKNIKPNYEGIILYINNGTGYGSLNDIVFVNRGVKDGIKAGMYFDVVKKSHKIKTSDGIKILPQKLLGRIKVLNAREHSATGIIIDVKSELIPVGADVIVE